MQIIKKRQHKRNEMYYLVFEERDRPGEGFTFRCNKEGVIDQSDLNPFLSKALERCLNDPITFEPKGIKDYSNDYTEPAVGKCSCGREVELYDPLTNECHCGALYNGCGQALAPQSQWEEPWKED